jgi:hypothetical protein
MLSNTKYVPALALLASVLVSPAAAQLTTNCNPTLKTCPSDPALGIAHTFNFNSTPPDDTFTSEAGLIEYDDINGAAFTLSQSGESRTLASNFYFFFGRTEVLMKAAPGQGIISSIVWGSDTLDEVDWEFKGANDSFVFSNYFGKGRVSNDTNNGADHKVSGTIFDLHNYTSVWTKDQLEWHLDGNLVSNFGVIFFLFWSSFGAAWTRIMALKLCMLPTPLQKSLKMAITDPECRRSALFMLKTQITRSIIHNPL